MTPIWKRIVPSSVRRIVESRQFQAIAGNAGWLMGDRVLRMGVGLVVSVWLARYLGPELLGTYRYSLAIVAMLSYLADLGLNGIVVRDLVEADDDDQRRILGTTFVARATAGVACMGLAVGVVWYLRPDDVLTQIVVFILSFQLLTRAFDVFDLWFQSEVQSRYSVIAKNTAFLCVAALKIGFILFDASLVVFAVLVVVEMAAGAVGMVVFYRKKGPPITEWTARFRDFTALLNRSWPLILSGFGAIIYLKVDQIMLGELASERAVGIYAVAAQLSEVWYFFPAAIVSSVFPALLDQKAEDEKLYRKRMQQLYDGLALAAFALAIPTTFLADTVINLVYGNEFAGAGAILAIHIWACLFIFMRKALSKWIIAEDLYIFSILTHGVGAIANVALNLYFIPLYEGYGAAIATVISYAAASYLALFLHRRTWRAARMMTLAILAPVRLPLKYLAKS